MALWPANRSEHGPDMQKLCEQPGPYAQFIACAGTGAPRVLVDVALRTGDVNGTGSAPVGFLEGFHVMPSFRKQPIAALQ